MAKSFIEFYNQLTENNVIVESSNEGEVTTKEDPHVTDIVHKKASRYLPNVRHVVSQGTHHIYAAHSGGKISYIHHDTSTGKTTKYGSYGKRATESNWSDMKSDMHDSGLKLSDKAHEHISNYHDDEI